MSAPRRLVPLFAFVVTLAVGTPAHAVEFRATADAPVVMYDVPSVKGKALFVYGHDVPVEVLTSIEGWTKVRDSGGAIGWMQAKGLVDKRVLLVRVPTAEVRANPEEAAAVVFRAEQNVLLELAEAASSPATTANPGWVRVRHRDGQVGFVRLSQVYGL